MNGLRCIPLEEQPAESRRRTCSSSFGTPITELSDLEESMSYFASRVTTRMRRDNLLGQCVQVFVTTKNNTADLHYSNGFTLALPEPTSFTPTIASYARAGINILGLTK